MIGFRTIRYRTRNGARAFRRWVIPYFASRIHRSQFRPLLSYLFSEWECNIDCHYCFDFDNKMEGMTLETAMQSIDWLKSVGCRVVGIMGGEPLLRRDFVLKMVDYGSRNGFFVYLPTNGILMTEDFIDKAGAAGVAAINLALDCVEGIPGLPKSFARVEPQFRYLVQQKEKYGYLVFFNINITSKNMEDVKLLTEIAHGNGIGTDYHINEPPRDEEEHYKHHDNDTYIRQEQWEEADELLDWLIDKNQHGYPMVNSADHLRAMKGFIRGKVEPWECRAGHNSSFIRSDGTLAPCFGLLSSKYDWGRIWTPRFDAEILEVQKEKCKPYCLSTCQYNLGHYYTIASGTLRWTGKHARLGR
jgi:MoaA/NifB/PqqE/SkfB family radical SAM enzyme